MKLEKAAKDIAAIKKEVQGSALDAARKALDKLEAEQPTDYAQLMRERR